MWLKSLNFDFNFLHVFSKLWFFQVAKKKSLFDDRPVEIQELTYIIKQDINALNKQIADLQEVIKTIFAL